MQELLTYMLDSIIEGEYTVTEEDQDGFIVYKISAPSDQIGRVIGKNGKTINALKNILKVRAVKENIKVDIQIAE
ncbi:MAG: KH domain-containing protein [Candidatus Levybacteria bacterium]|nr:KH domain-containing protein [Candidatus Levybacteria bacterium]